MNLRESHKPATTKSEHPMVQIGDAVVIEEWNLLKPGWWLSKMEWVIKGHDNQVKGAHACKGSQNKCRGTKTSE